MNRGLEAQLREAEHLDHTLQTNTLAEREDVFWRVEREEIHLSERELGRGGWAVVKVAVVPIVQLQHHNYYVPSSLPI